MTYEITKPDEGTPDPNDNPLNDIPEIKEAFKNAAKQMLDDPELNRIINKEPETKVNIISQNGFVLIQFSSPVQNLKISKTQAKEMAHRLVKEAS